MDHKAFHVLPSVKTMLNSRGSVSYSMSLFLRCLERMSVLHFRPQRQEWKHGEVWHALGHHSFPPHVSWALCWAPDTVRPGEHKAPALQRLRLVSGFLSDPGSYKALPTVLGWEMATLLGPGSPDPMTPGLLKLDETLSCNCIVSKTPNIQHLLSLMQILRKEISGHPTD